MTNLSISDHAWIAATYDYRPRRRILKLAIRRAPDVYYFEILAPIRPDMRAALVRNFETTADANRENKEKEKAVNDKEKASSWIGRKFGKKGTVRDNDNGPGKDTKKGKRRSQQERAAWRKELEECKEAPSPTPDDSGDRKTKKEVIHNSRMSI